MNFADIKELSNFLDSINKYLCNRLHVNLDNIIDLFESVDNHKYNKEELRKKVVMYEKGIDFKFETDNFIYFLDFKDFVLYICVLQNEEYHAITDENGVMNLVLENIRLIS
jgi:hypothetical protein